MVVFDLLFYGDSTPFVDKAKPDHAVAADPDKLHSFKRDTNSRHKVSFPHSPQSLQKSDIPSPKSQNLQSAPSTGKVRTGCKALQVLPT